MYRFVTVVAAVAAFPVFAFAQTDAGSTNSSDPAATTANQASASTAQQQPLGASGAGQGQAQNDIHIRQRLAHELQQAGFSDVRVLPQSFLVRAKDRSGDPISMFITPNGVTEIAALSSNQSSGEGGATPSNDTATNPNGIFASVAPAAELSSKLIGTTVQNDEGKDIGTIKDIAFGRTGSVRAYIIGVGGFLGVGDRYVAVRPSALEVTYDEASKKWQAKLDANAAQLKAAPQFKYSNQS